jgi:hypothetical protein
MDNEINPTEAQPLQIESPQPSVTQAVVDEILKDKDNVVEMPPPTDAPKVLVEHPKPPKIPQQQKSITLDLQLEGIGKKVCKMKGHMIQGITLRQTQMIKDVPAVTESTIVICTCCGASLAQIRG